MFCLLRVGVGGSDTQGWALERGVGGGMRSWSRKIDCIPGPQWKNLWTDCADCLYIEPKIKEK